MSRGRAGCLGLLLVVAVVRATSAVSTVGVESTRSPVPGDNCWPYPANEVYNETELVDITVNRLTPLSVVDIWLNIQVRILTQSHIHRFY